MMNEIEYNAMRHSIDSIISLMKRDWEYFKLGSVDLIPHCFFQDLQAVLGIEDSEFTTKDEDSE